MSIFRTKSIILALLTLSLFVMQGNVFAGENTNDTKWILVGDSPLLDRSSKFLFNGYTKKGIRYAKKALARSQSEYSPVIARHNLCIGYHLLGEEKNAAPYCELTRSLPIIDATLKMIKPGLYKITRRSHLDENAERLEAVIAQNLKINGLNSDLPNIAMLR